MLKNILSNHLIIVGKLFNVCSTSFTILFILPFTIFDKPINQLVNINKTN